MSIQPYLFFNGRCEEAVAFHGEAIGAKRIMKMRFDGFTLSLNAADATQAEGWFAALSAGERRTGFAGPGGQDRAARG